MKLAHLAESGEENECWHDIPCVLVARAKVHGILFGPELLGWWTSRPRRFHVCVHKAKGHLGAELEEFLQLFVCARPRNCAKGHMFFGADEESVRCHLELLAKKQLMPMTIGTTWKHVLPQGDVRRLTEYEREAEKRSYDTLGAAIVGDELSEVHADASDADFKTRYIVNIKQNANAKAGSMTEFVPTLLRHSLLWSQAAERILLPLEHLQVQGIPALAELSDAVQFPSWIQSLHDGRVSTTSDALVSMAGNSIHSAVA
eukprot:6492625-Amphidinium_carterae.1